MQKETPLAPPFQADVLGWNVSDETRQPLLPATYRNKRHMVRLVNADICSFLEHDLDVERLNRVHRWLWIVGLPTSPRPLHYQTLKKREIVVSEQMDLHLVWSPTRIFLKPLPRYMISAEFWRANLCVSEYLYRTALGFLLSYVALIEREVDYNIAINNGLLPKEISWSSWLALAEEIMLMSAHTKALSDPMTTTLSSFEHRISVNPRFFYGELRLGRLDLIYQLRFGQLRGYFSTCTTYGAFIRDNINSLIALFAYATIVLSAMQVGLATQWLAEDYAFGMASYVFSVFSIIAPIAAIAMIITVLGFLFTMNLLRTLRIRSKRRNQGAGV